MLPNTNKTVTVKRFTRTGALGVWVDVDTDVDVYINQIQSEMVGGFDGAGSFFAYRMLTDGEHETIAIGDRIDDDTNTYEVKGKSVFDDITGVHHQYNLLIKTD